MTERMVVAGAGIGGLCAALALIRRGFEVIVCEQAPELREVGAGVQLSPNGTRVLAALDVLEDLRAVAVEAEAKEIRLWSSGETWPLFDLGASAMADYGFPYLMVHRGDLQTVLAKAVERAAPGTIRPGAEVVDVRDRREFASVILADGSSVDDLPCGENAWVSLVIRGGTLLTVTGDTTLRANDDVVLLADPDEAPAIERFFTVPRALEPDHGDRPESDHGD